MFIPKLKLNNITEAGQINKIFEEFKEIEDAETKDEKLEEGWDSIISVFNFMFLVGNNAEVEKAYKKVMEKLKNGGTHGDIEIDEYVEFRGKDEQTY